MRMRMILLLLACMMGNACAAATRNAVPEPAMWAGCYALELGEWSRRSANEPFYTPPGLIQLDTALVQVPADGGFKPRLSPHLERGSGPLPQNAYWEPISGDSILLSWNSGLSGVSIRAVSQPHGFTGVAQGWTDVPPPPGQTWPRANVRGERIACSTPQ
jgi:hypothetical protein